LTFFDGPIIAIPVVFDFCTFCTQFAHFVHNGSCL
jgi:hypothetical protein